jgi:large subunit ribosomal protein L9
MKILLLKDAKGMGKKGEVVEVKDGYARNFVIPGGLGIEATGGAMKMAENQKAAEARKLEKDHEEAEALVSKLKGVTVTLRHKAGEEGRLFGSVTNHEVAEGLQALGYKIDKKNVSLDEPIRHLGRFQAHLKLHPKVEAVVAVVVDKL